MLLRAVPNTGAKFHQIDPDLAVAAQQLKARRRWILKALASLTFSATLLVILVVMRRDRMTISDCLRSLDRPLTALQAQVDDLGQLPAAFPDSPNQKGLAYASDLVREYARQANGPVIIANSETCPLILRSEGNGVVIYENGKLHSQWWPRSRFVREWLVQSASIRKWDQARRAHTPQLP